MDLLIVGAGHAAMSILKRAQKWTDNGTKITLLNDHPYLYYSGMVPEYLGGLYGHEDVRVDLRTWCSFAGIAWKHGHAVKLKPDLREVVTADGSTLTADIIVFNIGAKNPGRKDDQALPTKPLHRLELLRVDLAEAESNRQPFRLAIAGGGAAGVEIALNVSARLPASLADITIVEPAGRLLPTFPEGMSGYAEKLLKQRNVSVTLRDSISSFQGDQALLKSGEVLDVQHAIWATGSVGADIFKSAGLSCTPEGFLHVESTLQHRERHWLFAAGDCASVRGHEHLDRIGVHAVKQGLVLARNVEQVLFGANKLKHFRPYPVAPLILSTGEDEALWTAGSVWLRGKLMLRLKHLVDINWMDRARRPGSTRRPLSERAHARHAGAH